MCVQWTDLTHALTNRLTAHLCVVCHFTYTSRPCVHVNCDCKDRHCCRAPGVSDSQAHSATSYKLCWGALHLQPSALLFHRSAAEDALPRPCERSPISHWETELTVDGSTRIVCMAAIVKVHDTELIEQKRFPAVTRHQHR